jgi:hypothetical protein
MSLVAKIISKFDDSGIKKAKHSFGGLGKALGAIGIGIGISEITNLLMESAKAASADQKSTQLLNTQLQKNAHATKAQIKGADKFIEKLSLQTGILDDDLRPSFGKLARATKDTKKAQDLLTLSLDAATVAGKPVDAVASAMAKAFNGNTGALTKMFPELKKSKDMFGDLAKEVGGAAIQQADPFMKFNNSIDILKEKLGAVILPLISDFVAYISKPGGVVDQVGKFLDDMSNPKTDAGKMFTDIKNAVADAFGQVKNFFALFGNGDAVKGFANIAGSLVKMLPALIAFKAIMVLSSAGKSLVGLVTAIQALRGTGGVGGGGGANVIPGGKGKGLFTKLTATPVLGTVAAILTMSGDSMLPTQKQIDDRKKIDPKTGQPYGYVNPNIFGAKPNAPMVTNNQITINVQSADPKATVDALGKYVKSNGKLPANLFPRTTK